MHWLFSGWNTLLLRNKDRKFITHGLEIVHVCFVSYRRYLQENELRVIMA